MVKKHKEDALSVQLTVEELQQEPFNPVLIYKHKLSYSYRICFCASTANRISDATLPDIIMLSWYYALTPPMDPMHTTLK